MARHKIITAGYLLLEKENLMLMLRRSNTGYHDGEYSLVSGHGDEHESLQKCIIREAKEEAGIIVTPQNLKLVHVLSRLGEDNEDRANFFWSCTKWEGKVQNIEPSKCDDLSWFNKNDLPPNIVPEVKNALNNISKGEMYSEFDFDKLL